MSATEISALINLLGDEDQAIRDKASERLLDLGEAGIDALRRAANSEDARLRLRARALLARTASDDAARDLVALLERKEFDLETTIIALARLERPDLDAPALRSELDRLGALLSHRLDDISEGPERAALLGRVLGLEEGFHGNAENYYDPRNSLIDDVLRRRVGIPISLSTIYMLAGRRAGLSMTGVGFPSHFLARLEHEGQVFFLDPFHRGRVLTRDACKSLLLDQRQGFREEYLNAVSDTVLFRRTLANLIRVYQMRKDRPRQNRIITCASALQGETP